MSGHNQQFDSFDQWVSKASSWLTRHPSYNNTEHATATGDKGWRGDHFAAICFDAKGRRCKRGYDFTRAHDEGAFPVRWIWPDQVIALAMAAPSPQQGAAAHD